MIKMLFVLDFVIRIELGYACNSPCTATTCVVSLADAITCWAEILKLETSDPLELRRLAGLLVQYNKMNNVHNTNNSK